MGLLLVPAVPLAAEAQQRARPPKVGYLSSSSTGDSAADRAFLQALRNLGYIEGKES